MKKLLFAILATISVNAFGQDNPTAFSSFITTVKQQDKQALADKVIYPLRRQYPLPAVNNKQEFLARYNELIDDSLTNMIIHSDPAKDWATGGWRGISLNRGQVWLDDDGKLIGINYQTATEAAKRAALIEADKKQLYPSLRDFEEPVMAFQTEKYNIRIDDLGSKNFRYTSWKASEKPSSQPELVIPDGKFVWEGSGGNHHFSFENNGYTYTVEVTRLGKQRTPPSLTITKDDKVILTQRAKK